MGEATAMLTVTEVELVSFVVMVISLLLILAGFIMGRISKGGDQDFTKMFAVPKGDIKGQTVEVLDDPFFNAMHGDSDKRIPTIEDDGK